MAPPRCRAPLVSGRHLFLPTVWGAAMKGQPVSLQRTMEMMASGMKPTVEACRR